jgi:hypothetical protein
VQKEGTKGGCLGKRGSKRCGSQAKGGRCKYKSKPEMNGSKAVRQKKEEKGGRGSKTGRNMRRRMNKAKTLRNGNKSADGRRAYQGGAKSKHKSAIAGNISIGCGEVDDDGDGDGDREDGSDEIRSRFAKSEERKGIFNDTVAAPKMV